MCPNTGPTWKMGSRQFVGSTLFRSFKRNLHNSRIFAVNQSCFGVDGNSNTFHAVIPRQGGCLPCRSFRHGRRTSPIPSSSFCRVPFVFGCRRTLVTNLSPTTSLLRSQQRDNEVYLIGTAHVSQASAKEVTELIDLVQPQTVFVELDPARAAQLWQQHSNNSNNSTHVAFWTDDADANDPLQERVSRQVQQWAQHLPANILQGRNEQFVANTIRGFYQMLKRYGLVPGVDMLAGMRAARRIGANLVYGDQDGNETIRKLTATLHVSMLWRAMTTPMPTSLQTTLSEIMNQMTSTGSGSSNNAWQQDLSERVEATKTRAMAREMTVWMQRALPDTAAVLIHHRDVLMAQNLHRHAGTGKVVAVVGMAHMDGIEHEWTRIDQQEKSSK